MKSMSDSDDPELLIVRPGVSYAAVGNVTLMFYRDAPTVHDLKQRLPLLARVKREHPEGGALISVFEGGIFRGLPDRDARAETARQYKAHSHWLAAGALVLRGDTLEVSLVRTLLRSMILVSRGPVPMRFFSEVGGAASWSLGLLEPSAGDRLRRIAEIRNVVEAMRRETGFPEADSGRFRSSG